MQFYQGFGFIPVQQLKVELAVQQNVPARYCHVEVMLSTATVCLWEDQMSGGELTRA